MFAVDVVGDDAILHIGVDRLLFAAGLDTDQMLVLSEEFHSSSVDQIAFFRTVGRALLASADNGTVVALARSAYGRINLLLAGDVAATVHDDSSPRVIDGATSLTWTELAIVGPAWNVSFDHRGRSFRWAPDEHGRTTLDGDATSRRHLENPSRLGRTEGPPAHVVFRELDAPEALDQAGMQAAMRVPAQQYADAVGFEGTVVEDTAEGEQLLSPAQISAEVADLAPMEFPDARPGAEELAPNDLAAARSDGGDANHETGEEVTVETTDDAIDGGTSSMTPPAVAVPLDDEPTDAEPSGPPEDAQSPEDSLVWGGSFEGDGFSSALVAPPLVEFRSAAPFATTEFSEWSEPPGAIVDKANNETVNEASDQRHPAVEDVNVNVNDDSATILTAWRPATSSVDASVAAPSSASVEGSLRKVSWDVAAREYDGGDADGEGDANMTVISPSVQNRTKRPARPKFEATDTEMVQGCSCSNGHFNDPRLRSCAVCGAEIDLDSAERRPRPALGTLTFDDGRVTPLLRNVVIGRKFTSQRSDVDQIAFEGDDMVSRRHVEIRLIDWDPEVVDTGSANGTIVRFADGREITATPNVGIALVNGCRIEFGCHSATYQHAGETP